MKRHILVTIQGAGLFVLDHKQPDEGWDEIYSQLDAFKAAQEVHSRVLSSSRKLLKALQLAGQAVPSQIKANSQWELKVTWFYRGLYLEMTVALDKRRIPLNGTLEPVGKALTPRTG